ncbi:hypothetical protein LSCM1_06651 [Leishmania martiniquensis]|uniref:C2HC/C3H-type domain-containing protein n=1 Tax=Leishmania martiniquensis TaxID=1580590 RepID=A0A836H7J3_9TRYP|nr:hypothetical protein LSCM1_06651 [Leishmania martiniquensis]
MPSAFAESKTVAQRPQFRVCYLCGQQFGSASIGIHIPQCYQKKLSQWEVADPAIRGPKPKHPDTVKWKGSSGATVEAANQEQYQEFNSQLVPCPHCARTFLPDRLSVHLRGCKANGKDATPPSKTKAGGGGSSASGAGKHKCEQQRSTTNRSMPSGPPLLPTCYLCGQQFGTASIGIHVPQCYEKKLAQWQNADPSMRGQPPKHPDTVNWRGRPDASAREQAEDQFQEFINNLEACPNCSRNFLPDRLVVHLRSCRPENPAKTIWARSTKGGGGASPRSTATTTTRAELVSTRSSGDDVTLGREKRCEKLQRPTSSASEDRLHPKRNRLPRDSTLHAESRVCLQCEAVEYDADAKFCRECGRSLLSKQPSSYCQHCGERVPQKSRFCGTCGRPVQGAPKCERTPGGPNENVPTARSVVCPACKVLSDADGNFCDNCGAALGDADSASAPALSAAASSSRTGVSTADMAALYCANCKETVGDPTAIFCEDCGGRLETFRGPSTPDADLPGSTNATLTPTDISCLTAAKAGKPHQQAVNEATKHLAPHAAGDVAPAAPAKGSASPSSEKGNGADPAYAEEDAERLPCSNCGRRFAPESLEKHERICNSQKKRRVFNATKQRLAEGATAPAKNSGPPPPSAPKRDWKAESEAFRRALREARQVDQVLKAGGTAKDLPPPTYSTNPDYVPCPHCQRRFAPDVAARHIPRCVNTVNRPKPPPRRR